MKEIKIAEKKLKIVIKIKVFKKKLNKDDENRGCQEITKQRYERNQDVNKN